MPALLWSAAAQAHYSARLVTFKALRCLYMAEAFRAQRSWPEAYVLYERAAELAQGAEELHAELKTGGQLSEEQQAAVAGDLALLAHVRGEGHAAAPTRILPRPRRPAEILSSWAFFYSSS